MSFKLLNILPYNLIDKYENKNTFNYSLISSFDKTESKYIISPGYLFITKQFYPINIGKISKSELDEKTFVLYSEDPFNVKYILNVLGLGLCRINYYQCKIIERRLSLEWVINANEGFLCRCYKFSNDIGYDFLSVNGEIINNELGDMFIKNIRRFDYREMNFQLKLLNNCQKITSEFIDHFLSTLPEDIFHDFIENYLFKNNNTIDFSEISFDRIVNNVYNKIIYNFTISSNMLTPNVIK